MRTATFIMDDLQRFAIHVADLQRTTADGKAGGLDGAVQRYMQQVAN